MKSLEVGHINSVSLRLDQTTKDHSLILESLFVIHNAIFYRFDLHDVVLNKEHPKKKFFPMMPSKIPSGKSCYYVATHTSDKFLFGTHSNFKVIVNGTRGLFG